MSDVETGSGDKEAPDEVTHADVEALVAHMDAIGPGPYGPFPKPPPPPDLTAPERRWESAWGDRGNWR